MVKISPKITKELVLKKITNAIEYVKESISISRQNISQYPEFPADWNDYYRNEIEISTKILFFLNEMYNFVQNDGSLDEYENKVKHFFYRILDDEASLKNLYISIVVSKLKFS